jgi:hypothetical protein
MPATARGCSEATERGSEDRRELVRDVRYNSQTHSDPLGVMTDRGHMSDTAVQSDTKSTAAPPSSDEIADLVSLVEGHFRQQASTHDHRACSDGESFESCWCQRGGGDRPPKRWSVSAMRQLSQPRTPCGRSLVHVLRVSAEASIGCSTDRRFA